MSRSFALPLFPNGTGLGNRLFHWCDAKIYCYEAACQFITPLWCRLSLGKHLRSLAKGQFTASPLFEYTNVFRKLPGDVSYQKGFAHYLTSKKAFLSEQPEILAHPKQSKRIICFDKSSYTFAGYGKHRSRLVSDLLDSVRPQLFDKVLKLDEPFIGLHVRIGDGFKPPEPGSGGFSRTGWLQQTPIEWFKETLQLVRSAKGVNYPAYIFTDGSTACIRPLLQQPNTFLFKSTSPVIDLLSLSTAWLILGSGSSSFSAFAAFLGSAHALTAPGHPFSNRGLLSSRSQFVSSINPRDYMDIESLDRMLS